MGYKGIRVRHYDLVLVMDFRVITHYTKTAALSSRAQRDDLRSGHRPAI